MKILILAAFFLTSIPAFAGTLSCSMTNVKDAGESYPKHIKVSFDKQKILIEGGGASYEGKFEKVNERTGNLQYDVPSLTDIADQTTFGKAFVDAKNGKVTLSVQQVGDSEGQWFITGYYTCK